MHQRCEFYRTRGSVRWLMPRTRTTYCALAVVSVLAIGAGCRTAQYRASNLPQQLLVSEHKSSDTINMAPLVGAGDNSSQLGPGDLISISICDGWSEKPVDIQSRVSHDGNVIVPLIGAVQVAGLEPTDA